MKGGITFEIEWTEEELNETCKEILKARMRASSIKFSEEDINEHVWEMFIQIAAQAAGW